jgi:hypothetical protein
MNKKCVALQEEPLKKVAAVKNYTRFILEIPWNSVCIAVKRIN